ncbi:hypothetical protein LY01_01278 [Nonlabens xylanidelens]|uniref:Uncharacterized protein n=1 Tax=Nonlabens xylanidelens TaxID=191564 RepID=A0A2S6INE6_9FLAO|nr:hypothetical protein [Nonlabens xylanidelens]PPK95685.1 hypothetical protein LY01_01278 [Nonlabens xylanidelens]PQJ22484.1 hypothetical protein BST94_02625 [Nonlabens xylanidelens]
MTEFKATGNKNDKLKWVIYIVLGISLLIFIFKYPEWHLIFKLIISIPIIINLLFDFSYLNKEKHIISELNFTDTEIVIREKKTITIKYSDLKYSIRKRKFDKQKTEIELKAKKFLKYKTIGRIHIKNWDHIFQIEKELENNRVLRTEWKPKTLWGKYWGIFIDLLFFATGQDDLGMLEYQERSEKEATENPIEKENNF